VCTLSPLTHPALPTLTPTPPNTHHSPPNTQISLQTAKALKDERQAEQCRDLRAVLNLLLHVTQSELIEDATNLGGLTTSPAASKAPPPAAVVTPVAAPAGSSGFDVARVVLVGLHIVLPLISPDLLKFPKLGRLYYSLLSYLLEAHTASVAALEPRHFGSLMASLEWGLAGSDGVVAHLCLEGVAGLGRYQLGAAQTGGQGLGAHAPGPGRSVVAHFQEALLRRLLLDETPQVRVCVVSRACVCVCVFDGARWAKPLPCALHRRRRLVCTLLPLIWDHSSLCQSSL